MYGEDYKIFKIILAKEYIGDFEIFRKIPYKYTVTAAQSGSLLAMDKELVNILKMRFPLKY